ncbi:hypothetical protein [Cellulomonas soli]|nr:hypothetical protein [Cellulomonas soli]NYI58495.1 hypothetical protein [Cellulomonas soli]
MSIASMAEDSALRLGKTVPSIEDRLLATANAAIDVVPPAPGVDRGVAVGQAVAAGQEAVVETPTQVTASPLAQLVKYIPTETITLYVAVVAALGEPEVPEGKELSDADFGPLWLATGILFVVTLLLTVGLSFRAQKDAGQTFAWPHFEIIASAAAFLVWAFSLPSTPLRDLPGFDYSAWNSVIILGGSVTIATLAYVLGKTVNWEKRVVPGA